MSVWQVLCSKWRIESQAWRRIKYDINEKFWGNPQNYPCTEVDINMIIQFVIHTFWMSFTLTSTQMKPNPFEKKTHIYYSFFQKPFSKCFFSNFILWLARYESHNDKTFGLLLLPPERSPRLQAAPCWGKISIDPQNIHHHHLSIFYSIFYFILSLLPLVLVNVFAKSSLHKFCAFNALSGFYLAGIFASFHDSTFYLYCPLGFHHP